MTPRTRKVVASVAGLAFALAGLLLAFFGQFVVARLADVLRTRTVGDAGVPLPDPNSPFYVFFVVTLCLTAGLSVMALLWSKRPNYRVRLFVYVILLAGLLPVAVYNYAHADYLVNRSAQAMLNVFLVVAGAVVVVELLLRPATTRDGLIVQALAACFLSLTAVFIPGSFSAIWLLNRLGVISEDAARDISLPALSTILGCLSAIIGFLKFRREASGISKKSVIVLSGE